MVIINLKVSMCRDIIANSNITIVNPCDSCHTDVNTSLNAVHVHVYRNLMYMHRTYVHILLVNMHHIINRLHKDTRLVNDVIKSAVHAQMLSNKHIATIFVQSEPCELPENREMC